MVKESHPDKGNLKNSEAQELIDAYKILINDKARSEYD